MGADKQRLLFERRSYGPLIRRWLLRSNPPIARRRRGCVGPPSAQLKTSPIIHGLFRRRALNRTAGLLALKI